MASKHGRAHFLRQRCLAVLLKPQDYISKDNLFYAANRALGNVGKILGVNFKNHAA